MVLSKVACTGASGMLGRHVVAALEAKGIGALCTSRSRPANLPGNARWQAWDLSDWKNTSELDDMFPGAEALVHMGAAVPGPACAPTERALFDANVRACLALGQWATEKRIPVVYVSGAIVYAGPEERQITEESRTGYGGLGGLYGASKLLGENVLGHFCGQGLALCVLRPSSIYGAGLPAEKMIAKFLRLAAAGEEIVLSPPTGDRVNLVHAADVALAILAGLDRQAKGCFNIAAPALHNIRDIALACVEATGKGSVTGPEPDGAATSRYDLDCSAARKELGFEAAIDLGHGLEMTWRQRLLRTV